MTCIDGVHKPMRYPVSASLATLTQEGLVLKKDSGNTLTLITAKGDTAVGVLDNPFINVDQTAKTTVSGDTVGVFFLGSGAIVRVASEISLTWTTGQAVYLADSTDGMVNQTASTSRPIGHYVGDGEATTASGDLISVILDVPIGAATV